MGGLARPVDYARALLETEPLLMADTSPSLASEVSMPKNGSDNHYCCITRPVYRELGESRTLRKRRLVVAA